MQEILYYKDVDYIWHKDFNYEYNSEKSTYVIYFKENKILELFCQNPDGNKPSLIHFGNDDINSHLKTPYFTAGNYDYNNLYDIKGNKISKNNYWSISSRAYVINGKTYFLVMKSKPKGRVERGIIDEQGNEIIECIHDSYKDAEKELYNLKYI